MNQSPGILLSILTPAVPSRLTPLGFLCDRIAAQIGSRPVEHLCFLDNKKRTVGRKRDALLRIARGRYVAFVDDDDAIAPDYVSELLAAMASDPDVITFRQGCRVNGDEGEVEFKLGNKNEGFKTGGGVTKRNAWHICAWRRTLAILSGFPDNSYGEDWAFAAPLCAMPNLREVHIPKVLHYYYHDASTTEAPPPTNA